MRGGATLFAALLLLGTVAVFAHDDDDKDDNAQKSAQQAGGPLQLTVAQREAVGILLGHPLPLRGAAPIEAYGTVLDPVALVTDAGHVVSTRAQADAVAADSARLERLYRDDNQASLKSLQAAQAQSVEASAQARAAQLSFALQWGPLAAWTEARRAALIDALAHGRQLLVRADVPGGYAGASIADAALIELAGVNLSARVLGPLARTGSESQSSGWLLQVERAPAGFGPGARARVQLRPASAHAGLLVPSEALVYTADGVYVYRQRGAAQALQYAPAAVKPVARVGAAWLVDGLNAADDIVVRGAGVLWSLEGIGSFSAAEEDHD
jgi:hypothetical protein